MDHEKGNGHKKITWPGMSQILRPSEGGRGADILITTTKPHKDFGITTRTILKDERQAALIYQVIDSFIEDEMWEDLQSFMYFLELQLSVKGMGIAAFLQGFTGIYSEKGLVQSNRGKWFKRRNKEEVAQQE